MPMRKKLFSCLTICSLCTALLMSVLVISGMYLYTENQLKSSLTILSDTLSAQLNASSSPAELLESGVYAQRVTLVDQNGDVLYDSRHDSQTMENHAQRTEIEQALENGTGWSTRASDTMGENSIYYARRLNDGSVLRVAGTQKTVLSTVSSVALWLLAGVILCVVLSMLVARNVTNHLVKPINAIDLDHPLSSDTYEELSPMLRRMEQQNRRIADQMSDLTAQRAELDAVLDGMKEGLVILDPKTCVLSMNPAARRFLGVHGDPLGQPLVAVSRHQVLLDLLNAGQGEAEMTCDSKTLRISLSPVNDEGTVILFQDVTAARAAEESRRQFSANVSHELRTPLTTISGYAEMLASGLANPSDAGQLGSKIQQESRRLLSLIEDILRLSRLDEGISQEMKPTELSSLAADCVEKLHDAAVKANVTVKMDCKPACVKGDVSLLSEMITNLVENSIKYNKVNGSVTVETGTNDGHAFIRVADTGVGIPKEHQEHVFERFYRVDKSRSKQTGGTGLGLSIVKHGAQLHHATIDLKSKTNEGTEITITF
jgi:two-component system, OmpR family, phosphate regulon sensor histidine kinase PhoR